MKDFALAFGGGAARGLAHIGVVKYLEENNLQANEVSGTSMGAIIASLYAFGKTSDEMKDICSSVNYLKLIDIDLRKGLLKGGKIRDFFVQIFGDAKIEDMKIPLKIVATDLLSGEKKVFDRGLVVDAIRASISIPGAIVPYKIGKDEFVDGGIVNNLPIEVLECKNILAVSVIRDISRPIRSGFRVLGLEMKHNIFGMSYQILQKSIDIMMKQNEERSLESDKNIVFIHPKFPKVDYYEFHKYDEIIDIGYHAIADGNLVNETKKQFFFFGKKGLF